jgi:Flp pilus assembly protein TadD
MIPPLPMLTTKNRAECRLAVGHVRLWVKRFGLLNVLVPLVLLSGCTPAGPRALLEGKRLLDDGQYPQAIQKLTTATELLGRTNAVAWNYLGLAYQHAGEAAEAEWAYQRALQVNHDLSEVHYNLGCLWLAQNKLEPAKGEFTAYTLRRPNAAEGFVKLGTAQLRAREPSAAEKSFNEALRLNPQNPEAINGLGLARLQRGRAAEAEQCFESALKQQPSYRPALLNLAIVSHQYLRNRPLALQKYREYLALKPAPANADALAATVRQLEQELNPPVPVRPPVTNALAPPKPAASGPKPPATNVTRKASAPKPEPAATISKSPVANPQKPEPAATALKPAVTNVPKPVLALATAPPPTVDVPKPAPAPVPTRPPAPPTAASPTLASPTGPTISTSSVPATGAPPPVAKRSFFERINPFNLFRSADNPPVQPLPPGTAARPPQNEPVKTATADVASAATNSPTPPVPGSPGHYAYQSPPPPSSGNEEAAQRAFEQGVQAYQAHRLTEAIQAYRLATQADPSLFEARYNLGLAATEAGNLTLALTSYEQALALRPASLDARYNFALVLKQANFPADAAHELEKVLATYPNETRARLALGNLYAQQLRQPAQAREQYLKVLELDPQNPQAAAIRYWLRDHPP